MAKKKSVFTKIGRPRKYDTAEELEVKIAEYFDYKDETGRPPSLSGLALFLGFCDRVSLYNYERESAFSHTIKRARATISAYVEEEAMMKDRPAGAIWMMKCMGWKEQSEETGEPPIKIVDDIPDVLLEAQEAEVADETD